MDPLTIAVAGVAALAVILIAFGIASSGSSGISDRLERYASGRGDGAKTTAQSQGPISDLIAQSQALANLNKVVEGRDFGANLARELARADLRLKPTGIRPKFVEKFEVMGINLPPGLFGFTY